jgi:hypothetical protein
MKVMISPKTDVIFLAAVKCCVVLDQENGMQALSIAPCHGARARVSEGMDRSAIGAPGADGALARHCDRQSHLRAVFV